MKIPTPGRQFLAIPYRLARLPLQMVEQNVIAPRLPADSPARRRYERVLEVIDRSAGELLGLEDVRRRGEAARQRQDALDLAEDLDAEADRQRQAAEKRADREITEARDRQREAARRQVEREADARQDEQAGKQEARARAEKQAEERKTASARRAQADRQAADRERRAAKKAVDAQQESAQEVPRQQLEGAAERRDEARQEKADAERLGEAADAVAEERRANR